MGDLEHTKTKEERVEQYTSQLLAGRAFEYTEDDTHSYVTLATGIRALMLQGQKTAEGIHRELDLDDKRREGDPKKLTPKLRSGYEDYLSEVKTWEYMLPHLLGTIRAVQYSPDVGPKIDKLTDDVQKTLFQNEKLEETRLGIIERSILALGGRTIRDLAAIATVEWLRKNPPLPRKEVESNPHNKEFHFNSIKILAAQEATYKKQLGEVESSQSGLRKEADEAKAISSSGRVTQGLPGAEFILDRPEVSLGIWKKLLLEASPRETKRGAKLMREGVTKFQKEFLQREAYAAFEQIVDKNMRALIASNKIEAAKSKKVLGFLLGEFGEAVVDRLVTHPEEFESAKAQLLGGVQEAFGKVASSENIDVCNRLSATLQEIEAGKKVDTKTLVPLIDQYIAVQTTNRDLMAGVQRWNVVENAQKVGGAGEQSRLEQMVDQSLRMDDGKSGIRYWMETLAPYGAFSTRGFVSNDGRTILLPASDRAFYGFDPLNDTIQTGKAAVDILALRMMVYLAAKTGVKFGSLAPIAAAESQMAVAKSAAHVRVHAEYSQKMQTALDDLRVLETGKDSTGRPLSPAVLRQLGQQASQVIFQSTLSMIQAVRASDNPFLSEASQAAPKPELVLEAHLFTNQLLNAFGFPGYHQLPDSMQLPSPDQKGLSPEIRAYLEQRQGPSRDAVRKKTHDQLTQFRRYEDRALHPELAEKKIPEVSRNERMLRSSELPALRTKEELLDLLQSQEFQSGYKEFTAQTTRADVLKNVGKWFGLRSQIYEAHRSYHSPNPLGRIWRELRGTFGAKPYTVEDFVNADSLRTWKDQLQNVQKTSLRTLLHHIQYLKENPPTDAEILQWYRDAGITGIGTKQIRAFFGEEGQRSQMTDRLISAWMELHAHARTFSDEKK